MPAPIELDRENKGLPNSNLWQVQPNDGVNHLQVRMPEQMPLEWMVVEFLSDDPTMNSALRWKHWAWPLGSNESIFVFPHQAAADVGYKYIP